MKKLFLLAFYLILSEQGSTCICQHPFTYCESMQAEAADLVVLGYKFTDKYHGMGIKVVQVLDGVENRDTLTVWGDNGMLCRTYCGTFGMGDTVLFALHHCDLSGNGGGTLEKPEDYQISVCGVYWLDYENGEVTGAIDNGTTSLSLNEFKQYHSTCSPTGIEEQIPAITLYPNPIKGILTIEGLKGKKALYDSYGRLVKSTQTSTLDISQEASGIYLLKLTDEQGTVYSQKVVKE
ncbi:MAG TPA: T9SS type A sorting domain-containing protein [Flavobacteriales bacterium]|nr:T9SS type A sorting domain-containing protein [Flavobacteriales bacterium]